MPFCQYVAVVCQHGQGLRVVLVPAAGDGISWSACWCQGLCLALCLVLYMLSSVVGGFQL